MPAQSVTLTAAEIDAFIDVLWRVRASMTPEVQTDNPSLSGETLAVDGPQFYVSRDRMKGGSVLQLRHPGLGWIAFHLPQDASGRLRELLESNAALTATGD